VYYCTCTCAGWVLSSSDEQLVVGKVESGEGLSPSFRLSLIIEGDFTWKLHSLNQTVPQHSSVYHGTPDKLCTLSDVQDLLQRVNSSSMCIGNPDSHFIEMMKRRKGVIMDKTGVASIVMLKMFHAVCCLVVCVLTRICTCTCILCTCTCVPGAFVYHRS